MSLGILGRGAGVMRSRGAEVLRSRGETEKWRNGENHFLTGNIQGSGFLIILTSLPIILS